MFCFLNLCASSWIWRLKTRECTCPSASNWDSHAYWFSYAEHVSSVVHKKFRWFSSSHGPFVSTVESIVIMSVVMPKYFTYLRYPKTFNSVKFHIFIFLGWALYWFFRYAKSMTEQANNPSYLQLAATL